MQWQTPQSFPGLGKKQIHIWRTPLDRGKHDLNSYLSILNSQEKERAARYISKKAADDFIIARAVLRILLAGYLNSEAIDIVDPRVKLGDGRLKPEGRFSALFPLKTFGNDIARGSRSELESLARSIDFQQNNYGKLYLASSPIRFNISHSGGLAAFMFALDKDVGIDVEFIRENYEFADIAKRFFSKSECSELFALPEGQQLQGFFNCWSRKEAFIKALGTGLYSAFDGFSVGVSSEKRGKIDLVPSEDSSKRDWQLEAFDPGSRYSGAFVADLPKYTVQFYDFC